jgi:hypothetical protein
MRKYLLGALIGALLSLGAAVYADVTTNHYAAQAPEDVAKCVEDASNNTTVVSFKLSPDGIDYSTGVCWPDGIK